MKTAALLSLTALTTLGLSLAGAASAQYLTLIGFVEFEAHYGENYDLEDAAVRELDFAVDGRLNFDYTNATKSGLEWGAHLELDLQGSDGNIIQEPDAVDGSAVYFNGGYVFVNSALGNVKMGDTGDAAETKNHLHVCLTSAPVGQI
jgi:hypothetical protein